jgi:epoxyqueuosine reductase
LTSAYDLDATRCLSYLTIETRGRVPLEWREAIGARIYGCDICQDVCPWNRRAADTGDAAWRARPALAGATILDLCRLSDDGWRQLLGGSAMRRAGLARLRRSLAYASASLPAGERRPALDALRSHPSAAHADVCDALDWAERPTAPAAGPNGR